MSFIKDNTTDNYITNKNSWDMIKEFLPHNKKIWAPFYCDGKQKEIFKELGHDIIHQDQDFFSYTPEYDLIVDNPPFSKIKKIIERLSVLDKPFILIMPPRYFGIKFFMDKFRNEIQVIVPPRRPTFTHHTETNIQNYTPPGGTYYFCYKMNLRKDFLFLE